MYAAPSMTPVAARKQTQVLTSNTPSRTRNSPTKPLVPGSPTAARVKTMNTAA